MNIIEGSEYLRVNPRFWGKGDNSSMVVSQFTVLYAEGTHETLPKPRNLPVGWARITQPTVIDGVQYVSYVDYCPATIADPDFIPFKGDIPFGD